MKQTKLRFKKFSDSDLSDDDDGARQTNKEADVGERRTTKRAAASRVVFAFSDEESESQVGVYATVFPQPKVFKRSSPSHQ